MCSRVDLLAFQMEEAYGVMRRRLDGLTDDEFKSATWTSRHPIVVKGAGSGSGSS